jgi:hypothetical protein
VKEIVHAHIIYDTDFVEGLNEACCFDTTRVYLEKSTILLSHHSLLFQMTSKEVTLYTIIYCILQELENKLKQPTA